MKKIMFYGLILMAFACSKSHDVLEDTGIKKDVAVDVLFDATKDSYLDANQDASIFAQGCQVAQDCMLAFDTCCGSCDFPKESELVAILKTKASEYQESLCEEGTICPGCAAKDQYAFHADCQANQCVVLKLADSPMTICESDDDCQVRRGECCECVEGNPGEEELVTIRKDKEDDYQKLVCDSSQICDQCEPSYGLYVALCLPEKGGKKMCQLDAIGL